MSIIFYIFSDFTNIHKDIHKVKYTSFFLEVGKQNGTYMLYRYRHVYAIKKINKQTNIFILLFIKM